jgi:chromosome partitioning protein
MTVVTVASNKGGTGKTTTAVSLSSALATLDSVILVDLDAQGHAALSLGLDNRSGVFDWLAVNQPLTNCLLYAPGDLMVMPGDSRTKLVETYYREQAGGFDLLIERLRSLPSQWTVLDTAPGGFLQEAALAASDHVIVPFEPETLGLDGVYGTLALIDKLARSASVTLLPVAYDRRIAEHKQSLTELLDEYGSQMVADYIPARSAVKAAIAHGESIWAYQHPRLGDVRVAYAKLVDRVRAHEKRRSEA